MKNLLFVLLVLLTSCTTYNCYYVQSESLEQINLYKIQRLESDFIDAFQCNLLNADQYNDYLYHLSILTELNKLSPESCAKELMKLDPTYKVYIQ